MEKYEAYFGLKLFHLVFGASEQLSATLQYKDINAQEISSAVNSALAFLERQQSDSVFDKFYDSVLEEAKFYTEEPTLPRKRKLPKRYNDGAAEHQYDLARDMYRHKYVEVLDLLISEVRRRFHQPSFMILHDIEQLLVNSCNATSVEFPHSVADIYAIYMLQTS